MNQLKYYRASDLVGTAKSRKDGQRGMLPFSPAQLWRMVKTGAFPAPVKLSAGVTAFPAHKVDAWMSDHGGAAA